MCSPIDNRWTLTSTKSGDRLSRAGELSSCPTLHHGRYIDGRLSRKAVPRQSVAGLYDHVSYDTDDRKHLIETSPRGSLNDSI